MSQPGSSSTGGLSADNAKMLSLIVHFVSAKAGDAGRFAKNASYEKTILRKAVVFLNTVVTAGQELIASKIFAGIDRNRTETFADVLKRMDTILGGAAGASDICSGTGTSRVVNIDT
eukprot:49995-Amphidinium_carterae.1